MLRSTLCVPLRCRSHLQKRHAWNIVDFFGPKIEDREVIPILQGTTNVFKQINAYSDRDYGGGSKSEVSIVPLEADGTLVRWRGTVDFSEEHSSKSKAKGGFVAVKMFCKEYIDMLDYEGLKFQIRSTTDRSLLLNMKCKSYIQQDLYQLGVDVTAGAEWKTVFAPFNTFVLTAQGKVKEQPKENDSLQLESLGFLMTTADTPNGKPLQSIFVSYNCSSYCLSQRTMHVTGDFDIEVRNIMVCNK